MDPKNHSSVQELSQDFSAFVADTEARLAALEKAAGFVTTAPAPADEAAPAPAPADDELPA